ncbi:MAG: hypothetical protein JO261_11340 [Alphaproteobacteria bacterium]|nr:hypothetical protein [Alphaproteobacteria bacterium]MBV9694282.1 hypothetical protein [Alphaproteobacteria bacterium]
MPSAETIARRHFAAAVAEAVAAGYDPDSLARYMLGLAVSKYLEKRTVEDVRSELLFVAENCDPQADFVFMRP